MRNKHRIHNSVGIQPINIDALYNSLRANISNRNQLQERMRNLWSVIKKTHGDHSSEMKSITERIGNTTHKINELISRLCQYKKTHKAMNLAFNFLKTEIERINNIVRRKERDVRDVESGRARWINSTGKAHTNSSNMREYINKKVKQRDKLQNWLNYVSRYSVK